MNRISFRSSCSRYIRRFASILALACVSLAVNAFVPASLCAQTARPHESQSLTVDYVIGPFSSAVSLSVNASGELVVLDAGADACIRLSADGTELSRQQGRGWGTGEFDGPTDVCATFPLAVFVADGKNRRVQQFDKDLHYVQTIGAPSTQGQSSQQTDDTQLLEHTFRPVAATESSQGELFVIDADANRVVKFTTRLRPEREFGTYASGAGRLEMPTDLCLTQDGKVAVCDGKRIVYFDQFGNYLFTSDIAVGDTDSLAGARTVSSQNGDVIATAPDRIIITEVPETLQEKPQRLIVIDRSMIIGERGGIEELRDAARTESYWFVLTPRSILVCKRPDL